MNNHWSGVHIALVDMNILSEALDVTAAKLIRLIVAQTFNDGLLQACSGHFKLRDPWLIHLEGIRSFLVEVRPTNLLLIDAG